MNCITNPVSNIPKNPKSHSLGWSQVWSQQLGAKISHVCDDSILEYETVYLDYGVNYSGSLNLFGGVDQAVYNRLNTLLKCENIVALDWPSINFGNSLVCRIGKPSSYEGLNMEWCNKLRAKFEGVKTMRQQDLNLDSVMVGDSHSPAFSMHDDMVFRNDGQTLFGALTNGLGSLMRDYVPRRRVSFCLGSIDIRHHILRYRGFDLKNMITEYVKGADKVGRENKCEVYFMTPVPVEYEGRRLPKSGWYRKTPFFGSLKERQDLTESFIELLRLEAGDDRVIQPPLNWYTMDPEEYARTRMEATSSFHISPEHYRRNAWFTHE